MLLSDIELRAELAEGRLQIEPLDQRRIQQASIDLSLSNIFYRPALPAGAGIEVTVDPSAPGAKAYDYLRHEQSDELLLTPGDFVLGETKEAIAIPRHLAGWIEGKSGLARHGLIVHCTAPHIGPGWGVTRPKSITLEIVNLGKANLKLRAGTAIAQLLVMRLGAPVSTGYSGRHAGLGS